jgi:hypothetical protein
MDEQSRQVATETLLNSLDARRSRRTVLKGALGAGAALAGTGLLSRLPALAADTTTTTPQAPADAFSVIFTVARTAEQLAVTFYENGIRAAIAGKIKLSTQQLDNIKAAAIEEQIHQQFFTAAGGGSLATTFSFPYGLGTFADLGLFIATQQMLEGVFDAAFIAAVYEFAQGGRPDLAQIAAEIAMVESEHRALGRSIAAEAGVTGPNDDNYDPADNWAYGLLTLASVGQAPAIVSAAGFLSPNAGTGNSFDYAPIDYLNDPVYSDVNSRIISRTPVTSDMLTKA